MLRFLLVGLCLAAPAMAVPTPAFPFTQEPLQEGYTPAKARVDRALGFASLFASLWLASFPLGVRRPWDLLTLRTPPWPRLTCLFLSNIAMVASLFSLIFYLGYRQARFDYPMDGDSLGIPIIG